MGQVLSNFKHLVGLKVYKLLQIFSNFFGNIIGTKSWECWMAYLLSLDCHFHVEILYVENGKGLWEFNPNQLLYVEIHFEWNDVT